MSVNAAEAGGDGDKGVPQRVNPDGAGGRASFGACGSDVVLGISSSGEFFHEERKNRELSII